MLLAVKVVAVVCVKTVVATSLGSISSTFVRGSSFRKNCGTSTVLGSFLVMTGSLGGSMSCPNFRRCLSQYLRYCLRLEIALPRRTARKFGALGNLFSVCWMSQNSKCEVSIDVDLRYLS